jgi:Cupin
MHLNSLLALLSLTIPTLAIDHDANPSLNQQLFQAPTWLDRWNILANTPNNPWKYDFATNPQYPYRSNPGAVCNANLATWPALEGIGATVAQLNLGPCSMLPPHSHREHNVVVAITGNTSTMMVQENGAGVVRENLNPGQATIFPRASMHTMINDGEFSSGVSVFKVICGLHADILLRDSRMRPEPAVQLPDWRGPGDGECY